MMKMGGKENINIFKPIKYKICCLLGKQRNLVIIMLTVKLLFLIIAARIGIDTGMTEAGVKARIERHMKTITDMIEVTGIENCMVPTEEKRMQINLIVETIDQGGIFICLIIYIIYRK